MSTNGHNDPRDDDTPPSIDPPLAAQHAADLNERAVAEFEGNSHRLGLSREEDVLAYQVWFGLREALKAILRSFEIPQGATGRVALQATFMTLRAIELAEMLADLHGVDEGLRAIVESKQILLARHAARDGGVR